MQKPVVHTAMSITLAAWLPLACLAAPAVSPDASGVAAHVRQPFPSPAAQALPAAKAQTIRYRGGPVMTARATTLYIIYYGHFPDTGAPNDTRRVLDDFFSHIGGSPQFNVNSTYYDANGAYIQNALTFSAATTTYRDAYSMGRTIRDADIQVIVRNTLQQGHLPTDDNGIYFVVTSPDATSKLNSGCAWHDGSTTLIPGHALKYSSIPVYGGKALQGCSGSVAIFNESNSPNDNLEADNALDSFMHELSEAVTDPLPSSGWLTPRGSENGDLCNFNYGTTYIAPNGTHANAHIGNRDYLVQTIWQNTGAGFCANTL